jgi:hypothetical protein
MPTTFEKDDILHRFGVDCNRPPAYRVITLTADGVVDGEPVGGIGVSVLCKDCLAEEYPLNDLGDPIMYGENSLQARAALVFSFCL